MKQVTFVLCGPGRTPVGGFRIVYEYANRLAARDWIVSVVHPAECAVSRPFFRRLRSVPGYLRVKILKSYLPGPWFDISSKVRMLWVPSLSERHVPDADCIVACPSLVAHAVNSYSTRKGRKFYFIQGFEDWAMPRPDLERTWKLPMQKIVIAKWLLDIAHGLGEEAVYIPNGMDFTFFNVNKSFRERPLYSVLVMSHFAELKGTRFAVEAVVALKKQYPELVVQSFGVRPRPEYLPEFVRYTHNPSQQTLRDLYNSSTVFVSPSLAEGWPLPPAEAMLCGCVVVATDIGGHREYLEDGHNGFFCRPASAEAIAEKVAHVFDNPDLAQAISLSAPGSLRRFDWDSRVDLFESALLS